MKSKWESFIFSKYDENLKFKFDLKSDSRNF